MKEILFLILGGSTGTLLRYSVSKMLPIVGHGQIPLPTIAVNLIGSFVIGFLWGGLNLDTLSPAMRNLIFIGMLGSFTTFSTYALDIMNLVRFGETKLAILYFLISNVGGILLVSSGFFLSRFIRM